MYIDFKQMGKRIARRRRDLGLKQNELAEKAQLSNNYLSNIERGHSIPSIETFAVLCKCLKTTPDAFLIGTFKTNDIPQNIVDNLRLCDSETISLVEDFVQLLLSRQNNKK